MNERPVLTQEVRDAKVRYVGAGGLKLRVSFEVEPEVGLSAQQAEEARAALKELGLEGDVDTLS